MLTEHLKEKIELYELIEKVPLKLRIKFLRLCLENIKNSIPPDALPILDQIDLFLLGKPHNSFMLSLTVSSKLKRDHAFLAVRNTYLALETESYINRAGAALGRIIAVTNSGDSKKYKQQLVDFIKNLTETEKIIYNVKNE